MKEDEDEEEDEDDFIERQTTDDTQWKQMWIRKEPDADGYFLLEPVSVKTVERNDEFLTAEDASSLTVARK